MTIRTTTTVPVTIQVQRQLWDDWRDDGHLNVDLIYNPASPDALSCLGADLPVALLDYLRSSVARPGIYRLGEDDRAPVFKYENDDVAQLLPRRL